MKFTLTFVLALITVAALAYGGYMGLQTYNTKIRSEAVDGCLQASLYQSSFSTPEGGAITTETAIESDVNKCLEKKGIELK